MKLVKIFIMNILTLVFLLVLEVNEIQSLNLDVENAHVFSGPMKNSYFGYTVGFVKSGSANEKWILIGAPRANDTAHASIPEPGALYRCKRGMTNCLPLDINTESTPYNWMGVSLDIGAVIMVCGHRWMERASGSNTEYNMNGICVEMGRDFDTEEYRQRKYLSDASKQVVNGDLVYRIGAMGMSCSYAPTESSFTIVRAMGAPGIYESSGGAVHVDSLGAPQVVRVPQQAESQLYGYAVTFGKLYRTDAYNLITGGPRDQLTGRVKILDKKTANFKVIQEIPGEQVGSYFGSSITTTPLQNNQEEYLLVGAPMYAAYSKGNHEIVAEIGKVHIYKYNPNADKMVQTQTLMGSGSAGSRFGSAIMGLNDINGDKYYDIAVGAPYEDDGRGAVYIFNGYHSGFWPRETQKIKGRDINDGLRTFGASISKPFQYNDDIYYDTLIGAFMSDNAVLLYSQPPINMKVTMEIDSPVTNDVINDDVDTFTFRVCFSYKGEDLPDQATVEFTVDIDTNTTGSRRRVMLGGGDVSVSGSKAIQKALLQQCVLPSYSVKVLTRTDLFVPLTFSTKYKILHDIHSQCVNNVCPTVNTFNGALPNPTIEAFNKELTFKRPGCGNDNVCQADLVVEATKFPYADTDLFVGETATFEMDILLINNGPEWAYTTTTEIEVPEYINFVKSDPPEVACFKMTMTILLCQIPKTLKSTDGIHFYVKFDASQAPVRNFVVKVTGKMVSDDTNTGNNVQTINVSVKSQVNEVLKGYSSPEIYVTKEETETKYVLHKFDFENNGPSALMTETKFAVKVPFLRLNNKDLFVLQKAIVTTDQEKVVNVSAVNSSVNCWTDNGRTRSYFDVDSSREEGLVSHMFNIGDSFNINKNAINKDCQTDACQTFTCGVSSIPAGFAVSITMTFVLNPDTLALVRASLGDDVKDVKITSVVMVDYPDNQKLIGRQEKEAKAKLATVTVYPNKPIEESVPWWVIFLSIVGAIALIALIVGILWKVGFFKRIRPQREEATELMGAEDGEMNPKPNNPAPVVDEPEKKGAPAAEPPKEDMSKDEVPNDNSPHADTASEDVKLMENDDTVEEGDKNKLADS